MDGIIMEVIGKVERCIEQGYTVTITSNETGLNMMVQFVPDMVDEISNGVVIYHDINLFGITGEIVERVEPDVYWFRNGDTYTEIEFDF